jgi:hypothetical protein
LLSTLLTWDFAVASVTTRVSADSEFDRPWAMSRSTSRSRSVSVARAFALAGEGDGACTKCVDDSLGDGWVEQGFAGSDGADRVDEFFGGCVLE